MRSVLIVVGGLSPCGFEVGHLHPVIVQVCVGDTVSVCPDAPDEPLYIARVCYMWEEGGGGRKMFHGQWFSRGSETVLGEVGDPCELYAVDQCDDNPLGAIMDKVKVPHG